MKLTRNSFSTLRLAIILPSLCHRVASRENRPTVLALRRIFLGGHETNHNVYKLVVLRLDFQHRTFGILPHGALVQALDEFGCPVILCTLLIPLANRVILR